MTGIVKRMLKHPQDLETKTQLEVARCGQMNAALNWMENSETVLCFDYDTKRYVETDLHLDFLNKLADDPDFENNGDYYWLGMVKESLGKNNTPLVLIVMERWKENGDVVRWSTTFRLTT